GQQHRVRPGRRGHDEGGRPHQGGPAGRRALPGTAMTAPSSAPAGAASAAPAAPPAAPPARVLLPPCGHALLGAGGARAFPLLQEAVPRTSLVSADRLPPASTVLATLAERAATAQFWTAVGDTLTAWGLGLAIAIGAAVLLGFAVGTVPVL